MAYEREPEHQRPHICSPFHPTNDTTGLAPEVPQDAPFFATKEAFLHAVYNDWRYFIRFLIKRYPMLFERERETGSCAPVHSGWHVPLSVPKAKRTFDALLGSCDVQDILVDAMERCLNPKNATHYTRYTPIRHGRRVQFTTWFLYHVRSCAWSRIRSWKRRWRREKPLHSTNPSIQEENETTITVDAFITQALATSEDVEMEMEDRAAATVQNGEPSHDPSSVLDARLDIDNLMVYLTEPEKTMLRIRLTDDVIGKDLGEALGYTPSQARSKLSYILKKMRRVITKYEQIFPQNCDCGE